MTVRKIIQAEIDKEAIYQKYHALVATALVKFKGKKITKRVESAVVPLFYDGAGSPVVHLDRIAGQNYLRIWGTKEYPDFNNSIRHFLGYDTEMVDFDPAKFEEHDACYGPASAEREKALRGLLAGTYPEKVDQAIQNLDSAIKDFRKILGADNPARYRILHALKVITGLKIEGI